MKKSLILGAGLSLVLLACCSRVEAQTFYPGWLGPGPIPNGGGTTVPSGAFSTQAPTVASGFGTAPSVVASNGTAAFTVNVGTGGTAATGVVTLPAAVHGWACSINDITTISVAVTRTRVTATTTTSVTVGNYTDLSASGPWAASDVLQFQCVGY